MPANVISWRQRERTDLEMATGSDVGLQSVKGRISKMSPASVVYWSRLGFAVLAGVAYNALGLGRWGVGIGTASAVGLGILLYAASIFVVMYVFKYSEAQLSGPRKQVSLGMGSYVIWLIFTITLLNTLLYPPV